MASRLQGSRVEQLPARFPVGTRYVIEGRGGGDGHLHISLRRLEFPDGHYVDLPTDKAERTAARRRRVAHRRIRK